MFNIEYTTSEKPPVGLGEAGVFEWTQMAWARKFAGVESADQFEQFTSKCPSLGNAISSIPGFEAAVSSLRALRLSKTSRVLIYGDYDADGITSSAILKLLFQALLGRTRVDVFIPDRYRHGYGPTSAGIRAALVGSKPDMIVFVDTGSGAPNHIAELAEATDAELLIIDHHEVAEGEFPVIAHLNPRAHPDDTSDELKECSAAGLAYLFVDELSRILKLEKLLNLDTMGVIAAIGTVADVVNLSGINRAIVSRAINHADTVDLDDDMPFLAALILELGGVSFDEHEIGWKIAPAINALSRLGRAASPALDLFLPSNRDPEANAVLLKNTNQERKDLLDVELKAIEKGSANYPRFETKTAELVVSEMSEGLIGLVAGRLARKSNLPSFVGSIRGDIVKFSGRTPDDRIALSDVVQAAKDRGILIGGGGHAGACGFSMLRSKVDELADLFDEMIPRCKREVTYTVAGDLDWIPRYSTWVDLVEGLRPFGGSTTQRPIIYAPEMKILTHPSELKRRKDGVVWAKKFWVSHGEGGSLELTVTDLVLCNGLKRGDVFNMVLQPERSATISGVWTNWKMVDLQPISEPASE